MNVIEAHIYKLNNRYKKNDNVNRYAVRGERERERDVVEITVFNWGS